MPYTTVFEAILEIIASETNFIKQKLLYTNLSLLR